MSSVEDSERGEDSLSEELLGVLKMNRHHRVKGHHRTGRSNSKEDALYREALKEFMFGKFEEANETCKRIIAIHPENPEPYYIMGTMHEEAGKRNDQYSELCKAAEYFFFHAYYAQPDLEKWLKVADMSFELKIYHQAAYCYGRALKINGSNLETNLKRCESLELCHETKKAIAIYKKILEKISNSVEVYKRYARLQFRKGEFAKSREILLNYEGYKADMNIKFMVCETFLKEKLYEQLFDFLRQNILDGEDGNIYDLEIEIVQMLFICAVCTQTPLDSQALKKHLLDEFVEGELDDLYEEIVAHIQDFDEDITFEFVSFLLKSKPHRTIENYLYASEHLKKNGKVKEALRLLKEAVRIHSNSTEIETQLNHMKVLNSTKPTAVKNPSKMDEDIFYSDEDQEPLQQLEADYASESEEGENRKKKLIRKAKRQPKKREVKNPQISRKLLSNTNVTLEEIYYQIRELEDEDEKLKKLARHKEDVKNCLEFLSQLDNQRHEETQADEERGIFFTRNLKKRRGSRVHSSRRFNFIYQNSQAIGRSLRHILFYMRELVKAKCYEVVLEFAQHLSKANFFKCKNKISDFQAMKTEAFEMGVLACLFDGKLSKSLFFLRHLIHKHPDDSLYLLLIRNITGLKSQKMGLSSIMKRDNEPAHLMEGDQSKIFYLMGLEYMDNCFFELAITMFLQVLDKASLEKSVLTGVHLCLVACFLQIGSSRTVFNKLDFANRSAFCLKKYQEATSEGPEVWYNLGRWFCQVKMFGRAVGYLRKVLEAGEEGLKKKAAYCLLIAHKEMEDYEEVARVSREHFALDP